MSNPNEFSAVLDNGTVVSSLQNTEKRWDISSQLVHVKQYLKYGVHIKPGDTIFDIGANIGMFGLVAYDLCNQDADVYCFEPIPHIFEDLEKNLSCVNPDRLKAFLFGFSNINGKVEFTYYPNAPALSTIHPENMEKGLEQMITSIEEGIDEIPDFFDTGKESEKLSNNSELTEKEVRFKKLRTILGLKTAFQEKNVICDVKTVSSFIQLEGIDKIDLLKIDVNGSELDIINGIDKEDFKKINQIVIEVPLGGEKLDKLKSILESSGFSRVTVEEQDPVINKGLSYYIVYAVKE